MEKDSPFSKEVFTKIIYPDTKESDNEYFKTVATTKDYTSIVSNAINSINKYSAENQSTFDYPFFKMSQTIKFVPKLSVKSDILNDSQLMDIHQSIPYYQRYKNLKLIFSTAKHGTSMSTFYEMTKEANVSIVIIKDDSDCVFGGYLSEPIKCISKFYGTGESFIFTFYNNERIKCFEAHHENDYYIYTDNDVISMGCSDDNFSFLIRDDFLKGSSRYTKTYKNKCLSIKEEFFVTKLEFWTFDDY